MSHPNEGQDRLDYQETADVTEVHAAIAREHAEPSADVTPIPTWLSIVCAVSLCWAGAYIGVFQRRLQREGLQRIREQPGRLFPAARQRASRRRRGSRGTHDAPARCEGLQGDVHQLPHAQRPRPARRGAGACRFGMGGRLGVQRKAAGRNGDEGNEGANHRQGRELQQPDAGMGAARAQKARGSSLVHPAGVGKQGRRDHRGAGGRGEKGICQPQRPMDRGADQGNPARCKARRCGGSRSSRCNRREAEPQARRSCQARGWRQACRSRQPRSTCPLPSQPERASTWRPALRAIRPPAWGSPELFRRLSARTMSWKTTAVSWPSSSRESSAR